VIGGGFERGGPPGRSADHRAYPGAHPPGSASGYRGAESAVEQTLSRLRALDARGPATAQPQPDAAPAEPRNLADLYRDHRMRMVRLAVLLVDDPSTAEDVVQEAFTGLHRHWAGLRDEAAAVAYLRTAVVNGSRSVLRRRRTARKYVLPHQPDSGSAEGEALLNAEHRAVLAALDELAPRQREVVVLRYWSELSEAEIADALGISRGSVKSTASRALDALEKILGAER
jgi:RNA polymerase sigma-70 factor (sigma-E family)